MATEGENSLDWDEGEKGKGVIDEFGGVHTFNDEEYDNHLDYENQHGFIGQPQLYFYIHPHGEVHTGPFLDVDDELPQHEQKITEADPRLHITPQGWHNAF